MLEEEEHRVKTKATCARVAEVSGYVGCSHRAQQIPKSTGIVSATGLFVPTSLRDLSMRSARLFLVAPPALLALTLLGRHLSGPATRARPVAGALPAPDSEPMVAEAVLLRDPAIDTQKYFYLPVKIQGRPVSMLLDTEAPFSFMFFTLALTDLGLTIPATQQLNEVTIGTTTERHVPAMERGLFAFDSTDTPPGLPPLAGLIGNLWLRHYDLLFEGPTGRMRLYKIRSARSASHAWLPGRLTPADCLPLYVDSSPVRGVTVHMKIRLNGVPVSSWFHSGLNETVINVAAAKLLGITQHTPHLKSLPLGQPSLHVQDRLRGPSYEVDDIPISIGAQRLTIPRVFIFGSLDVPSTDKPYIRFGSEVFSDRPMLISNSSRQFCVGAPQRGGHQGAATGH